MGRAAIYIGAVVLVCANAIATAEGLSPQSVEGAITVTAVEAKGLFEAGALFVDVRSDNDWMAGRIPGAVHLELKEAFKEESLKTVAGEDEPLVVYCNGPKCGRSAEACAKAVSWGFKQVYYFRDGFPSWKASSYPFE